MWHSQSSCRKLDMRMLSRRTVLASAVHVAVGGSFMKFAYATPADVEKAIADFSAGKAPAESSVGLDLPEAADNGASVPLTVTIESPMGPESYVQSVMIGAEHNPYPVVATFHFTPLSGRATVTTRIRLAETQTVTAVAKLNDGTIFIARKTVEVTVGGCG
jgi:sulfur-oxidizing protein SoxY